MKNIFITLILSFLLISCGEPEPNNRLPTDDASEYTKIDAFGMCRGVANKTLSGPVDFKPIYEGLMIDNYLYDEENKETIPVITTTVSFERTYYIDGAYKDGIRCHWRKLGKGELEYYSHHFTPNPL